MPFPRPTPTPRPLSALAVDGLVWRCPPGSGGAAAVPVTGITHDSRTVRPGDVYAALPGAATHGGRFVDQAAAAGAAAILTDAAGAAAAEGTGLPVGVVEEPRAVLGEVSARAYGQPAQRLLLIGLTGTNGKTTTSYLVEGGLSAAGHVTGVIGTTGVWIGDEVVPSPRTTPEAPDLHAILAVMLERGVSAVVMEVSSHALMLGRVDGVRFDVALFTNLSQDHLDFHGSMADYFAAKADLFTPRRAARAVICVDDEWGRRLAATTALPVTTYAVAPRQPSADADYTAWRVEPSAGARTAIAVACPDGSAERLVSPLPGRFNAANALGAYTALVTAGIDPVAARQGLLLARSVPGRMERIMVGAGDPDVAIPAVFVDYAHTPDAVRRVIGAGRELARGRVVVVLGCGGDRDRDKRPVMGRIGSADADELIVTDDNPRSEDPAAIRAAIMSGVPEHLRYRVREVADRRAAIGAAVAGAGPRDVVLVLGKGHETGQEVAGTVYPFDDRHVAHEALRATAERGGRT